VCKELPAGKGHAFFTLLRGPWAALDRKGQCRPAGGEVFPEKQGCADETVKRLRAPADRTTMLQTILRTAAAALIVIMVSDTGRALFFDPREARALMASVSEFSQQQQHEPAAA
jgi:hypothetical protein